jgi:hypothetical protein
MASFHEQKLQQALEDLHAQKFSSIRAAAKAHNVHQATLHRRSKGGISKPEARVAQQLLSQEQEGLLVKWILMAFHVSKVSGDPQTSTQR